MNIISSFSYPGGLDGLCYDGEYLWIGMWSSSIYKIDTTGNFIGSWPAPEGSYSYGMAFDGTHLWHSQKDLKKIYELDYNNPTVVIQSFTVTWTPKDLAWYNGHLWATANGDFVYELDPTNMSILSSYPSGRPFTAGLAIGGGYLWFGSNNSNKGMVYKVDMPLAIEEVEFTALSGVRCCKLRWNVNMEIDIVQYILYRKSDRGAYDYFEISRITASGSSPSPKTYSYKDENVGVGERYSYKLCLEKTDGSKKWFGPVSVKIEEVKPYLSIYPNPSRNNVEISYGIPETGKRENRNFPVSQFPISLCIYDMSGRLVKSFSVFSPHPSLIGSVSWDGNAGGKGRRVPAGIYFVKLKSENYSLGKKITLLK